MDLTFLNAAFLLGALAALLPLIIHLFSRRRVETVDFSSLRFLRELERRKIRRIRVRQILLLIIRSLLILAVALALARPTLRGPLAAGGGHARTSVVIVLDDSASMSRGSASGESERDIFGLAGETALEVAGLLDEGDQAFLVTASYPARSELQGGTFSRGTLADALREIEPGALATDYSGAVAEALDLLSGARNLNRELYVIGDMQKSGWRDAVDARPSGGAPNPDDSPAGEDPGGADARPGGADRPTAFLFPVDGPVGNFAVVSASARRRYGGAEGLYSFTAEILNGSGRQAEVPVRLFLDGVQVGRAGVSLSSGERGSARFSASVDEAEWHRGWVELPADVFAADNRRYFVIPPLRRTEVLIVSGEAEERSGEAYYAERALDPAGEGRRFRTALIDASDLAAQDPARFATVVLADAGRLGDDAVEWVERYVASGGGLFVILGDRTDLRQWNSGDIPGSGGIRLIEPFESRSGVRLAPSGQGHPLLEGLVFGERLIDDIGVTRGFAADAPGVEQVLEFPGLGPALLLAGTPGDGSGEVAVLLTGVDREWSDLPRTGFVVPLFHRVVGEVSGLGALPRDVLAGGDLVVPIAGDGAGRVEVRTPDGGRLIPEHLGGSRAAVVVRDAVAPGIYEFVRNGAVVALGAVNLDPSESDLSQATREEISGRLGEIEHAFVDPGDDIEERVLASRRGRELWRVFVYVALALLALEMFLARQRAG
ncbi:MAG: VWA domain-containing protein [Candidatus Eisenbacteria bacterium]|nr:VWA domain-containing protein [Candidatus Eisenbacteria bacterium]